MMMMMMMMMMMFYYRDRIRTTSNVLSHTVCAAITHHFCHKTVESAAEPELPELEVELIVHSSDSHNQPLDSRIVQYEV